MREDGKPVASRLADDAELYALCDVLGELNSGIIETILGRNKMEHFDAYYDLAKPDAAADHLAERAPSLGRADAVAATTGRGVADFP